MKKIVDMSMLGKAWVGMSSAAAGNDKIIENDLIKQILAARSVTDADDVAKFLNPQIKEYMPDPSVLLGMDTAVRIIADAIIANKKIAIYGDYDVDGITSTAIFVKYLRELGTDVVWHLPTREGEGYGLNIKAVEELAEHGVNLIVTVDCGISGINEINRAHELGVAVVVTDHHSPDATLPNADAIVNPKRDGDTSGLSYMAGVGVAFLTLVALSRELRGRSSEISARVDNINLMNYLDMVALGTICDTMPLVGLNRAFAATGLKVLNLRQNMGLRVLMEVAGIKNPTTYSVMFAIGPRLNAAGRLDSSEPVLQLLLTDNILVAYDLANKLNDMNQERIGVQNAIMIDAGDMAKKYCASGKYSLFICGDNWRKGVMGIIAGRLKDKYNRPTCVATCVNGIIDGSGRSIPGVDLGKIIHDALAAGILSEGGGHAAAAGFELTADHRDEFCEFLEAAVSEQLGGIIPEHEIVVDAEIDAGGANMELVRRLARLEPFGQGNPEPVLVLHGATLMYASTMGVDGAHLRGTVLTSSGAKLAFVGFNMTSTPIGDFLLDPGNTNTKIIMLGKLKENEYQGRVSAQFILEDLSLTMGTL